MKKYLKSISIVLIAVLLFASTTYASQEEMQAKWRGDYTNMNLVLNVKAPVDYIQNATLVMYPKGATPGFDTYCRVDEVTLDGRTEKEILIKIANDLTAPNGEYTVTIQGNGTYDPASAVNSISFDVYVMSPQNVSTLLSQINGVSGDTDESLNALKGYMQQVAAILKLENIDSASNSQLRTIVNVRNIDFASNDRKFQSLNDVENAWRATGLIGYLNQESIDATQLENEYNAVTDIMAINITDDDYTAVKTALYNNIIRLKTAFNNNAGIQTLKDAESIFNQAKALAVVNSSSIDDMESAITDYKSFLTISDETYNAFVGKNNETQEKILRQLVNKNFLTVGAVEQAFYKAVSGSGTPEGGGGSSPDRGDSTPDKNPGSLGGVPADKPVVVPPTPSTDNKFSDVSSEHWAYEYIRDLEKGGIISGYSDGKFYPGNSVKREEFVKMIVLASGVYTEGQNCMYDDVREEEWYFTYIASASQSGIINGIGDGVFGIGSNITREDVAVIVNRILNKYGKDADNVAGAEFTDNGQISGYAQESVTKLSQIGILNGFADGSFKPKANLTRAEASKIMYILKDYLKK